MFDRKNVIGTKMFDRKSLILYRNLKYETLIEKVILLGTCLEYEGLRADIVNSLLEFAYEYKLSGNLWQLALTFSLITNENAYSRTYEMNKNCAVNEDINKFAIRDLALIKELYNINLISIDRSIFESVCSYGINSEINITEHGACKIDKNILNRIVSLNHKLGKSNTVLEFEEHIRNFYIDCGAGEYALNKAFKLFKGEQGEEVGLRPVRNLSCISFDDIIGYESQKKKLNDNTLSFISKKPANNVLLFGDAGTGKSSSIKATLNAYGKEGLRIVEIYKHQFKFIDKILDMIKDRNYYFIVYMDDLSFEDNEHEYKYLKAVLEGGLANKPDNVLIYATSNRRHLIRESFKDKDDKDEELHRRDTVEEKLSLAARFGVSIYFGSPNKKEFNNIVKELAKKADIDFDKNEFVYNDGRSFSLEELISEANKWELSHGGLSGRCAAQFITYIKTQIKYRSAYEESWEE